MRKSDVVWSSRTMKLGITYHMPLRCTYIYIYEKKKLFSILTWLGDINLLIVVLMLSKTKMTMQTCIYWSDKNREREKKMYYIVLLLCFKWTETISYIYTDPRDVVIQPTKSFFFRLAFVYPINGQTCWYIWKGHKRARSITKQTRFRWKISFIYICLSTPLDYYCWPSVLLRGQSKREREKEKEIAFGCIHISNEQRMYVRSLAYSLLKM